MAGNPTAALRPSSADGRRVGGAVFDGGHSRQAGETGDLSIQVLTREALRR